MHEHAQTQKLKQLMQLLDGPTAVEMNQADQETEAERLLRIKRKVEKLLS